MLLTQPTADFDTLDLSDILLITIDTIPSRTLIEHGDGGPHAIFADVAEMHTLITITRSAERFSHTAPRPRPGTLATLRFTGALGAAGGASDAPRIRGTATAVLTAIRHDAPAARNARQSLTFVAVSADGVTDPLTLTAL